MLQTVAGREVYVVHFDTVPTPPITWSIFEEAPYAQALDEAIQGGQITEGGKYGIEAIASSGTTFYNVYRIIE